MDDEPVARWATDITVAEMVAVVDVVATEICAKGANEEENMEVHGECVGTLRAKSGHLFKKDRTASRFSSLFADFGDYDGFTTPGGSKRGMRPMWPSLLLPVIDTG